MRTGGQVLNRFVLLIAVFVCAANTYHTGAVQTGAAKTQRPLKLAIAGLVHGHVDGFLRAAKQGADVELVAVYDPDAALRARKLAAAGVSDSLGVADLEEMFTRGHPDAVAIFTSTADHRRMVEAAARHHVHAMMEKPLAITVADAMAMRRAAEAGHIQVLVNYETTWYPSLAETWRVMKHEHAAGVIRKMVAMDGHEGPKEIGVGPEFLTWLTDPASNGGGALYDFGCYGANLMTWLMDNARPRTVRALTHQFKPTIYPRVDDEATILLEYPAAQGIIQASWNWPYGRKDLEVYGERGYAIATGGSDLRVRVGAGAEERPTPTPLPSDEKDPLAYLVAVVRGTRVHEGRSSLATNIIVTEILEAARESARTGRAVTIAERPTR
jgi:predicted dehydrogenase